VPVDVTLTTCGGAKTLSDSITWSIEDSSVAQVRPAARGEVRRPSSHHVIVTARSPGTTTVNGDGARYGRVAWVLVTVVP
jgi:hypothetical protein